MIKGRQGSGIATRDSFMEGLRHCVYIGKRHGAASPLSRY